MTPWVEVTFWSAIGVAALLALWFGWRGFIAHSGKGRPRCPKCWYDMTGAPSFTCPECGHTPESAAEQLRRRRHPRSVVIAILLGLLIYYLAVPVRWRMKNTEESKWTTAIPTPALAAWAAVDLRALPWKTLSTRSETFDEVDGYCTAQAAHRRALRLPASMTSSVEIEELMELAPTSPTAARLYMDLMVSHPDKSVRNAMASEIRRWSTNCFGGRLISTPDIRDGYVRALLAGTIDPENGRCVCEYFALGEQVTDQQLLQELKFVLQHSDQRTVFIYLREVQRRNLSAAAGLLREIPADASPAIRIARRTVYCRLSNLPDPVSVRLYHDPDRAPDTFEIEISLTDSELTELPLALAGNKLNTLTVPTAVVLADRDQAEVDDWYKREGFNETLLRRGEPLKRHCRRRELPAHCFILARLTPAGDFPDLEEYDPSEIHFLPESNRLAMTVPPSP